MTQEETNSNFKFEKEKHERFFLPFYQEKNWIVWDDNIKKDIKSSWDVRLEIEAGKYKLVDEKAFRKEWNNCLVELIQDLKTGTLGWFFGNKDWVLYGSWNDILLTRPNSLYLIRMPELRNYIWSLKGILRTAISHKGWGITWNITLQWNELIQRNIVEKLI